MSSNLSRPSWKQCALLLILLAHTVFGSPTIPAASLAHESLEPISRADTSGAQGLHGSPEENVFGPTLDERSNRKKRFLGDQLKKAKQAKLLSLGAASSSAAKKIGKSVLKTVATLGVKAIIFNFLFSKINQVLDFKTRLLNNLEHKNREQNSQVGIGDASTADSNINTTTELPTEVEISTFDPKKVSLNIPTSLYTMVSNVTVEAIAPITGTLVQNTAVRLTATLDALISRLGSSSSSKLKKRQAFDFDDLQDSKNSSIEAVHTKEKSEETIKNSSVTPKSNKKEFHE